MKILFIIEELFSLFAKNDISLGWVLNQQKEKICVSDVNDTSINTAMLPEESFRKRSTKINRRGHKIPGYSTQYHETTENERV